MRGSRKWDMVQFPPGSRADKLLCGDMISAAAATKMLRGGATAGGAPAVHIRRNSSSVSCVRWKYLRAQNQEDWCDCD